MAGKRKRGSLTSGASPDVGSSAAPKRSRVQTAPAGAEPKVEIVWQLVGSNKTYSAVVDDKNLDATIPNVAAKLGASFLGLNLMHVRQGGYEAPVWDDHDYQAIKARAIATGSKEEIVRVYSAAIGQRPLPPSGPNSKVNSTAPSPKTPVSSRPLTTSTPKSVLKLGGSAGTSDTPRSQKRVGWNVPSDSPPNTPTAGATSTSSEPTSPSKAQKGSNKNQARKTRRKERKSNPPSNTPQAQTSSSSARSTTVPTPVPSVASDSPSSVAASSKETSSRTSSPLAPASTPASAAASNRATVRHPVQQYKPVRPSPLSQSAAVTEERPKKKSRASDFPPVVGTLPPVVGSIGSTSEPAEPERSEPDPEPITASASKSSSSTTKKGKEKAKETSTEKPAAVTGATGEDTSTANGEEQGDLASAKKQSRKAKAKAPTTEQVEALQKRRSLATEIAAQIAAQLKAKSGDRSEATTPASKSATVPPAPAPSPATPLGTPTPRSKNPKQPSSSLASTMMRNLKSKNAQAGSASSTATSSPATAVDPASPATAAPGSSVPSTPREPPSVPKGTSAAKKRTSGANQDVAANGSVAEPSRSTLANGAASSADSDLQTGSAETGSATEAVVGGEDDDNNAIQEGANRKTDGTPKAANGSQSSPSKATNGSQSVPPKATPGKEAEPSAMQSSDDLDESSDEDKSSPSASASDSRSASRSVSSSSVETPMSSRPAAPVASKNVDTPFLPVALHQKALIRPRRPGSMSGLSVSDAVIETADSSDSSDSSDSESISTASSSDSDSDSSSSGDSNVEPADLMRRIMVENPLSKRDLKKARISAASMHHVEAESASDIESDDEDTQPANRTRRNSDSGSSIGDFEEQTPVSLEVAMESDGEEDAERAKLLSAVEDATQDTAPAEPPQPAEPIVVDETSDHTDRPDVAKDEGHRSAKGDEPAADEPKVAENGPTQASPADDVADVKMRSASPEDDLESVNSYGGMDVDDAVVPEAAAATNASPARAYGDGLANGEPVTPIAKTVKPQPRSSGRSFSRLEPTSPALADLEGDIALREAIAEEGGDGLSDVDEDKEVPVSEDLPATQVDVVESQSQQPTSDSHVPSSPISKPRGRLQKNATTKTSPLQEKRSLPQPTENPESVSGLRRSTRSRGLSSQPSTDVVTRSASRSMSSSQPAPSAQPERVLRRSTRASSREVAASQPIPARRTRVSSRESSVSVSNSPEMRARAISEPIEEESDEETTPRAKNVALPSSSQTARLRRSTKMDPPPAPSSDAQTGTPKSSLPPSSLPGPPALFNGPSSQVEPTQATQSSPLRSRAHPGDSPLFFSGGSLQQTQAYNAHPPPLVPETQPQPQSEADSVSARSRASRTSARDNGNAGNGSVPASQPSASQRSSRREADDDAEDEVASQADSEATRDRNGDDDDDDDDDEDDAETATTASRMFPTLPAFLPTRSSQAALPSSFPTLSTLSKDILREGGKLGSSVLSAITGGRASLGGPSSAMASSQVLRGHDSDDSSSSDSSDDDDEPPVAKGKLASRYAGSSRRQSKAARSSLGSRNGW